MSQTPVVSLQQVYKTFGGPGVEPMTALEDISLTVDQGDFVSLIGPSGCGKSTLLRLVADLTPPTSGTILINNQPAQQARLNRDYGFVFQAATLFEWRSVLKNVELPLEVMGYRRAERRQRARDMLALVELSQFEGHYPWQLSGGMQQRVSIARALAFKPPLLLMDEPFGALDEMTRERLNLELLTLQAQTGTSIIFVTHSIAEAVFLSNRVVILSPRPGRITQAIDIDLPYPRTAETRDRPRFFELTIAVRDRLRGI